MSEQQRRQLWMQCDAEYRAIRTAFQDGETSEQVFRDSIHALDEKWERRMYGSGADETPLTYDDACNLYHRGDISLDEALTIMSNGQRQV
jgi:hypothetical protein